MPSFMKRPFLGLQIADDSRENTRGFQMDEERPGTDFISSNREVVRRIVGIRPSADIRSLLLEMAMAMALMG